MCRLWFSLGCQFSDPQVSKLRSDLDRLLLPGGPDFQQLISNQSFTAYHSRLAIQGLTSASNQPFFGRNSSVLLFNGEILNWRHLLSELTLPDDISFDSDTQFLSYILDTGLIEAYINKFKGFFAFVYFSPSLNAVLASRDCYGVKPLYFSLIARQYLSFSSTSEALTCHPYLSNDLNHESFTDFLKYGFFPFCASAFGGIHQFPPGKLIRYSLDEALRCIKTEEISSFTPIDSFLGVSASNNTLPGFSADTLLEKLIESCRLRAVSDVPISLFLSGGIDSSLLALVYSKFLDIKPDCFTLKFDLSSDGDESEVAAITAASLNLNHHILPFSVSDISSSAERVFRSLDQPFVDTSIIPSFILCDFVSRSYKVAISADGGDESYAGYPKYQRFRSIYAKMQSLAWLPSSFFKSLPYTNSLPQQIQKAISAFSSSSSLTESIYFLQHQIWSSSALQEIFPNYHYFSRFNSVEDFKMLPSMLSSLQFLDLVFYMLDDILYKIDRASMAFGLELREPMLDQDFVNYGLSIPDHYKLARGKSKACLRDLVDQHLPHVSRLPKKGFGIPLDLLYKSEFMQDSLSDSISSSSQIWNILDRSLVLSLLESSSLTDNQEWQLRSLLVWCKTHSI